MYASDSVSIIQEYVKEHLFEPSLSWGKHEFKKRSYEQWAAYEICERIMDHPLELPLDIIEEFIFEMYMFACASDEDEARTFIFQTAVETADEIALLFV